MSVSSQLAAEVSAAAAAAHASLTQPPDNVSSASGRLNAPIPAARPTGTSLSCAVAVDITTISMMTTMHHPAVHVCQTHRHLLFHQTCLTHHYQIRVIGVFAVFSVCVNVCHGVIGVAGKVDTLVSPAVRCMLLQPTGAIVFTTAVQCTLTLAPGTAACRGRHNRKSTASSSDAPTDNCARMQRCHNSDRWLSL
jgi:hypothetical protein